MVKIWMIKSLVILIITNTFQELLHLPKNTLKTPFSSPKIQPYTPLNNLPFKLFVDDQDVLLWSLR
ncbi:hypothetical protein Hanom_Chr06g00534071 [Helianthus anomalus]